MESLIDKIQRRIEKSKENYIFLPIDFIDLANRNAVDQVLHRLVKKNLLKRIAQGIYYRPKYSELLKKELLPSTSEIASIIAKRENRIIQPSGATAANMLGLSLQVPAKVTYVTNGSPKKIKIGNQIIEFKSTSTKGLVGAGTVVGSVIQALKYFGKDEITEEVTRKLNKLLQKKDKKALLAAIKYVPAWMRPAIISITEGGE